MVTRGDFPEHLLHGAVALDYETNGLPYWHADFRVLGFSLADGGGAYYWHLPDEPALRFLKQVLRPNSGNLIIAQFAQYEMQCSRVLGIDPRGLKWYCTMTAECLIDEHHLTYDLASIAGYHGIATEKKEWLDRIAAALGVDSHRAALARLRDAPPDLVAGYGASDTRDTFGIYAAQLSKIEEQQLERVCDLEFRLAPVLADMSWHGVRVDLEAAHASLPVLTEKIDRLQGEINVMVGRPFNVNSSPQIRDFFKPEQINKFQWRLIDGTLVGPTKTGKGPSLGQDSLKEIKHPLAGLIRALRKTIKLRDTFVMGHVIGSADADGYVHTTFNQTRNDADAGTVTGRLSSTDPALQQITKRDKENAAILRAMFLPDPGEQWLCDDYSQVDFRCSAHLQNDPNVISAYAANPKLDFHQIVSEMTGIPRNPPYAGAPNTKQINLGLSFGAGAGKLSFMMGMEHEIREYKGKMQYVPGPEAERIFALYHGKLPSVKAFMKKAENVARHTGHVRTAIGRRLRFPRGVGAHKAAGLLYQAYAADLHKFGLVMVDEQIRKEQLPARLMMSCHDEIGVSMQPDEEIKAKIDATYRNFNSDDSPIRMRVPIMSSAKFGANWWEASKD